MEEKIKFNYRSYVGPEEKYDLIGAMQFNLLTFFGLRESNSLLDIGCGSLRAGRLFIPYLNKGNYYGIEPNDWLIREGIKNNIGRDLAKIKKPVFNKNSEFNFSSFNKQFDYILAQSIFSHAPENMIRKCLNEAKKVMHKDSLFFATFLKGDQDHEGLEWVYQECTRFTYKKINELVEEQGFKCEEIKWDHPNGQTWILISYP